MRKIIIYTASSIDGYIAKEDGDIGWLENFPNPEKTDYGYKQFYESIDTTLMGNNTYKKVKSFDIPFPFKDKKNFVLTSNSKLEDNDDVSYITNPLEFINDLRFQNGKNIWAVGGGEINSFLLDHRLVDQIIISFIPIILGNGIKLFPRTATSEYLLLEHSKHFKNGVLTITYSKPESK